MQIHRRFGGELRGATRHSSSRFRVILLGKNDCAHNKQQANKGG
jgi:hypothetical protein